jgi:hypothetical protein
MGSNFFEEKGVELLKSNFLNVCEENTRDKFGSHQMFFISLETFESVNIKDDFIIFYLRL